MNNKNGTVYFILDTTSNLIKIGFSRNVKRRIKQLETSNCNLKLLYQVNNCNMDYEKSLHNYFNLERVKGEWFNYDVPIKEWIKKDKLRRLILKENF